MINVLKIISLSLIIVLLVGVLIYFWDDLFGGEEERPELDWYRYALADDATEELADLLPQEDEVYRVAMLPVARDSTDGRPVTQLLRDRIAERSKYSLLDEADFEEFVEEEWGGHAPEGPGQVAEIFSKKPALKEKLKLDGVLIPELEAFDRGSGGLGATCQLSATLLVLSGEDTARTIESGPVSRRIESRFSFDYLAGWMNERSVFWRIVLFLVVTLGAPFAAYPLVYAITKRENNLYNALLVLAFAGGNFFFALFLTGFYLASFSAGLLVVLGLVLGLVYNFLALDFLEDVRPRF